MAIAFRSIGAQIAASAATTVQPASPPGVQSGDIVVIFCANDGTGVAQTWSSPGFTAYNATYIGTYSSGQILVKTAGVSEPATYTVTSSASGYQMLVAAAWSGGALYDKSVALGQNSGTPTVPSLTPAGANGMAVWAMLGTSGTSVFGSFTQGTQRGQFNDGTTNTGITIADYALPGSAATPTPTSSTPFSAYGQVGLALLLKLPGGSSVGRRGYNQTIKGWRGRGVLAF